MYSTNSGGSINSAIRATRPQPPMPTFPNFISGNGSRFGNR